MIAFGSQVRVGARVVAAPWAPEVGNRTVRQEAHVRPDPAALARYQRVFPYRTVHWNVRRQCFEVMERLPGWGQARRVALVTAYATHPEQGGLWETFQPFNHEWVNARLAEYQLICREGRSAVGRHVYRKNKQRQRDVLVQQQTVVREWMKEDRRWLPVLAAAQAGARPSEAMLEKAPFITPGISLKSP